MNLPRPPFRLALLIEMSSAHGRGLLRGIAEYVRQNPGITLQHEEGGPLVRVPAWFENWTGDGVIARIENDEIARQILQKQVPVVNVSGRESPNGIPHIDTDNRGVCALAVEYFVKREFRYFAYFGGVEFEWSLWRQNALVQLLSEMRIRPHVFQRDASPQGDSRLMEWLGSLPKPVALLACNDRYGRMILEFCHKAGIAVPEEIAVLGVDNDDILCSLCKPQLSSIVPDAETIGYRAAQSLHQCLLQNPGVALEQWVPPLYLHSRASTDSTATEDWAVRQALQFIHGNAVRDIGVDEVVAHTSVSRRLLEQRFRSVLGRPIHEEILRVRLGEAQRLLSGTSLPLKDVALRSGFKRADYLSAVFRNKLGMSPTDYRQGVR